MLNRGTPKPESLREYLTQMFGWEFQAFSAQYLLYNPQDGGVSVGINQSAQMLAGGSPNISVRVADLDAMLVRTEALGGKIVVPKTQMGAGAFTFIAAPDGNLIGLQML